VTIWCICGSRWTGTPYIPAERQVVETVLGAYFKPGDILISGGCKDVDAWAMEYAYELGMHVRTLLPIKHDFIDYDAVEKFSHESIRTGLGYWARDRREVDECDLVLAFPIHERRRCSSLSGTWHTWDIALEQNKARAITIIRAETT
jgi:hypothetical protein